MFLAGCLRSDIAKGFAFAKTGIFWQQLLSAAHTRTYTHKVLKLDVKEGCTRSAAKSKVGLVPDSKHPQLHREGCKQDKQRLQAKSQTQMCPGLQSLSASHVSLVHPAILAIATHVGWKIGFACKEIWRCLFSLIFFHDMSEMESGKHLAEQPVMLCSSIALGKAAAGREAVLEGRGRARAGFRNREGGRRAGKWRGTAASSCWSYSRGRKETR